MPLAPAEGIGLLTAPQPYSRRSSREHLLGELAQGLWTSLAGRGDVALEFVEDTA
jgi:hypothetical protein